MAGATKLFATTIDIRDMTKWKAERRPVLGRSIRLSFAAAELRSVIAIEMRGCLMTCVTALTISPPGQQVARAGRGFPRDELNTRSQNHAVDYCQQRRAILEHRSRLNRSRFHEPKLRSRTGIGAFIADHFRRGDIGLRRRQMNKYDSRRAIHKTIIIVAASLALGTATVTTATGAFARGGGGFGGHFGGGGLGGHFGGGGFGGHFGAGFGDHFGGARFAGRDFGRRFGDRFGLYGFGDLGPYYGGYDGCYVFTPYGYTWACY
jgi:hypothetical protein